MTSARGNSLLFVALTVLLFFSSEFELLQLVTFFHIRLCRWHLLLACHLECTFLSHYRHVGRGREEEEKDGEEEKEEDTEEKDESGRMS